MSNPVGDLLKVAEFGMDVSAFLNGPVGRYLVRRAEAEIEAATEQLKKIDPTDTEGVRRLQNEIYRAEAIQYWLAEAIQEGLNAEETLQQFDAQ